MTNSMKNFKILYKDGKARVGLLTIPHGVIDTPNFIPVGTLGAVKALAPRELSEIGAEVVLANTYHLMLRPGADLIESFGGLHKFMGWDKPKKDRCQANPPGGWKYSCTFTFFTLWKKKISLNNTSEE